MNYNKVAKNVGKYLEQAVKTIYGSEQFYYIKCQAVYWHTVIYELLPLIVRLPVDGSNDQQNKKFVSKRISLNCRM